MNCNKVADVYQVFRALYKSQSNNTTTNNKMDLLMELLKEPLPHRPVILYFGDENKENIITKSKPRKF